MTFECMTFEFHEHDIIFDQNNWVAPPHLNWRNVFGGLLTHPRYKNNF